MEKRVLREFNIYNSTNSNLWIRISVSGTEKYNIEFTSIAKTYSKPIIFDKDIKSDDIIFQIADSQSYDNLSVAISKDRYIYSPKGDSSILQLIQYNTNSYVIDFMAPSFNILNFTNNAFPMGAEFRLYEWMPNTNSLGKMYWHSSKLTGSTTLNVEDLNIDEFTLLAVACQVFYGPHFQAKQTLYQFPILYSKGTGRVIGFKLGGGIFKEAIYKI